MKRRKIICSQRWNWFRFCAKRRVGIFKSIFFFSSVFFHRHSDCRGSLPRRAAKGPSSVAALSRKFVCEGRRPRREFRRSQESPAAVFFFFFFFFFCPKRSDAAFPPPAKSSPVRKNAGFQKLSQAILFLSLPGALCARLNLFRQIFLSPLSADAQIRPRHFPKARISSNVSFVASARKENPRLNKKTGRRQNQPICKNVVSFCIQIARQKRRKLKGVTENFATETQRRRERRFSSFPLCLCGSVAFFCRISRIGGGDILCENGQAIWICCGSSRGKIRRTPSRKSFRRHVNPRFLFFFPPRCAKSARLNWPRRLRNPFFFLPTLARADAGEIKFRNNSGRVALFRWRDELRLMPSAKNRDDNCVEQIAVEMKQHECDPPMIGRRFEPLAG